ncbi:DEAD/DEAH box helicase [Shewanella intestini]|uniref:DEAD/DEAH box helicase n=1 Tax=Shewanella intestini TaxID=2017544 RepID=A0ABS5I5E7_9GAMM|nr:MULTISPECIES: DEAD/DEAH box helicase [Shewanella]MBR9728540.1 DEAD/DEAH box helicase [Shewanella intestini]MRG36359.1 DEAD/DEAH box helicase [Shewanella sp. XMDDZSB0408]
MPFAHLGLSAPITQALTDLGYQAPTPIQTKAIPVALAGKNLIAAAQTGTGKTASFVLPILERVIEQQPVRPKRVKALIIAPTRELVLQVEKNIIAYSQHLQINTLAMYGGVDSKQQKQKMLDGIHVLVATPGRLLDMYTQRAVRFDELEVLVLDEADRMLDMGFVDDINRIIERLPEQRQNMLFSATLSNPVRALAKTTIHKPVQISLVHDENAKPQIEQWAIPVDKDKKSALLSQLIQQHQWQKALIFIETKHGAAKLVTQLEKRGIIAQSFHSGRSQEVREQVLADFKADKIQFIVGTGVVARGIDIDDLPLVINYDLPYPADEYIHRIGRTGRAGATGQAVSLLSKDDFKNFCAIERRLKQIIERRIVEGFEPKKALPVSDLNFVPKSKPATSRKSSQQRPTELAKSRGAKDHKVNKINNNKKGLPEKFTNNSFKTDSYINKSTKTHSNKNHTESNAKNNTATQTVPNGSGSFNPWDKSNN